MCHGAFTEAREQLFSSLLPPTPSSSRKGTQVVKLRQQATPLVSQLASQTFF